MNGIGAAVCVHHGEGALYTHLAHMRACTARTHKRACRQAGRHTCARTHARTHAAPLSLPPPPRCHGTPPPCQLHPPCHHLQACQMPSGPSVTNQSCSQVSGGLTGHDRDLGSIPTMMFNAGVIPYDAFAMCQVRCPNQQPRWCGCGLADVAGVERHLN